MNSYKREDDDWLDSWTTCIITAVLFIFRTTLYSLSLNCVPNRPSIIWLTNTNSIPVRCVLSVDQPAAPPHPTHTQTCCQMPPCHAWPRSSARYVPLHWVKAIFTARIRSMGKVKFSRVCLSVHGGGGFPPGITPPPQVRILWDTVNKRTVRILQEYTLVYLIFVAAKFEH